MPEKTTRRSFVKGSLAASAGVTLGMSLEERVLLAQAAKAGETKGPARPAGAKSTLPVGKIGDRKMSRLILGGNLIGGWAHARDLLYVSALLKHYFTEEKILETLAIAEAHGINTVNTHPDATKVIQRYRRECKGKMLWMVQAFPNPANELASILESINAGADAVYIQGGIGDQLVREGKGKVIGKALELIQSRALPAGVAGHDLDVIVACRKAKLEPDFYVKTLHCHDYWSGPDRKGRDNSWCPQPEKTIETMRAIRKPWVAYKVMAAGAIHPRKAFRHAFENGADFVLAGMFDWQIAEDVKIASAILARLKRPRPWRG